MILSSELEPSIAIHRGLAIFFHLQCFFTVMSRVPKRFKRLRTSRGQSLNVKTWWFIKYCALYKNYYVKIMSNILKSDLIPQNSLPFFYCWYFYFFFSLSLPDLVSGHSGLSQTSPGGRKIYIRTMCFC